MKRKIIFASVLALAIAWSGSTTLAFSLPSYDYDSSVNIDSTGAVNVGNSGSNVKVDADGSVDVGGAGGTDVKVDSTTGSVNVGGSGDTNVNVTKDANGGSSVNVTSPDGKNLNIGTDADGNVGIDGSYGNVNISGENGVLKVEVNGQKMEFQGGLSAQIETDLSKAQKEAVVSLQSGLDALIQTAADLEAYADLVEEFRPGIKQVLVNNNKVMVKYDQPGKFLWFKRSSLNATAEVDADGNVEIKLPWYSFLFSKDTDAVKLNITNQLNEAKDNNELTVSGDASDDGSVQVRNNAKKVNIVSSAVSTSVSN